MGKYTGKSYRPSNGTEGECFIERMCSNCIHGAYEHDQTTDSCDIVCDSFIYNINEKGYPKEWVYDENDRPTCTSFVKWDWGNDGDPNNPDNPKAPIPVADNQLMLFSVVDEILENHKVKETSKL